MRSVRVEAAQHNFRNRYPPPCDRGTRANILGEIYCWAFDSRKSKPVCFLYDPAGSGKSAIAQSVSERCVAERRLAASFFFNAQEKKRSTADFFVPTFAYQLAINVPALKHPICNVLIQDETILSAIIQLQFQKLIIEPLQSLSGPDLSLVVVIDGLNECKKGICIAQLMTTLPDPQSDPRFPLQFLITSRPEPLIKTIFEHPANNCIPLSPISKILS